MYLSTESDRSSSLRGGAAAAAAAAAADDDDDDDEGFSGLPSLLLLLLAVVVVVFAASAAAADDDDDGCCSGLPLLLLLLGLLLLLLLVVVVVLFAAVAAARYCSNRLLSLHVGSSSCQRAPTGAVATHVPGELPIALQLLLLWLLLLLSWLQGRGAARAAGGWCCGLKAPMMGAAECCDAVTWYIRVCRSAWERVKTRATQAATAQKMRCGQSVRAGVDAVMRPCSSVAVAT